LVGRGLSNKDVARELGLSPGTVKTHVHNIFLKLGERSRHRLIAALLSSVNRSLLFWRADEAIEQTLRNATNEVAK
jgi:predicted transcriptional regulator